jgi:hypothetical protein
MELGPARFGSYRERPINFPITPREQDAELKASAGVTGVTDYSSPVTIFFGHRRDDANTQEEANR